MSIRTRACAVTTLLVAAAATGSPALAASVLEPGQIVRTGQEITSPSGQHSLGIRGVEEMVGATVEGDPCGADAVAISNRSDGDHRLVMQTEGNLVFYRDAPPVRNSRTHGNPGARAVIQDDRNVVVYSAAGRPLFATGTVCSASSTSGAEGVEFVDVTMKPGHFMQSPDRRTTLTMQTDGNLVLRSGNRVLWHTHTHGNPGAFLRHQADGNLVVYSAAGRPLWNSGTRWSPAEYVTVLTLRNDGNLVLSGGDAHGNMHRYWQTGTRR